MRKQALLLIVVLSLLWNVVQVMQVRRLKIEHEKMSVQLDVWNTLATLKASELVRKYEKRDREWREAARPLFHSGGISVGREPKDLWNILRLCRTKPRYYECEYLEEGEDLAVRVVPVNWGQPRGVW